MRKKPTRIIDAWLLQPEVFSDHRGLFLEAWSRESLRQINLDVDFLQDNFSRSVKNVLRGLHYQAGGAAQGKMVWVTSGAVFDVIVDLRQSSPTFGTWEGHVLNADTHDRLWVPPGCAHGFFVLSDRADFCYKVSGVYQPDAERSLRWDDPTLAIKWPIGEQSSPILSRKDAEAATFEECDKYN